MRSALTQLAELVRKRAYHLALGSLACGLGCAAVAPDLHVVGAAAALAVLASLRAARLGLLCASLVVAGAMAGAERLRAVDGPGKSLRSESSLTARAHLLEKPRPTRFGSRAELRLVSGPGKGARLLARADRGARWPRSARVGDELVVAGRVRRPRPRAGARFDFPAYLRRRGIAAELWLTGVSATARRRGGLQGGVDSIRTRAERAVSEGVAGRAAALLRGMVLGQDDLIDEATRDDWRASGLAHLLAVSGQNVMLLVALALPLLAAARLPVAARAAALAALIALYVPLAGAGPSLQRAAVMGTASLAALCVARPASRWYALLLAVCVTLGLNPRAHGDPGWQLSFAAVAGILILAPGLRRGLARALPRLVADGVAVTVAATLATAPLLAHSFGSVPLVGLPANVLALPLVAPIMWLGMIRAALGQLVPSSPAAGPSEAAIGAVAGGVNHLLGVVLGPLAGALDAIARAFAEIPGGQLALPAFPASLVACAYAAMAMLALAVAHAVRRAEPTLQAAGAWWRRRPGVHRVAAACLAAGIAALLLARGAQQPDPPRSLTVSFLDVGQGDATLIQHPDGTAVLFDGGPPEARVARLLRRAGVRRLSALVMTHASRDHHGGLREVVERYPVDLLIDGGDGAGDHDFRSTAVEAVRRGARRIAAVAPMTVRVGAVGIRVLSPPSRPSGPAPEDPNPRAVVAVVSAGGFDLLLSADAESPTLSRLALPQVEAIKVPHHGSRDPGLPRILDRLRPQVAAVPVGENSYGHPAPSTLAALRAAGLFPHRTDREGTIRVRVDERGIRIGGER